MTTPLQDAQAMVAAYLAAETQLLAGKEVRLDVAGSSRMLRLEDLAEIRAGRKEWESRAAALERASARAPTFGSASFSVTNFSHGIY